MRDNFIDKETLAQKKEVSCPRLETDKENWKLVFFSLASIFLVY